MPKIYAIETITAAQLVEEGFKCDCCGKEFRFTDGLEGQVEIEEMVSIDRKGGFGSVWGDGSTIELDVCQTCFKKRFEDCARVSESGE